MYAASGMRNTIAIATVIVQAVAIRATVNPRPSLGASSCARNARNGVRRSMRLAADHADQQERSGGRQHMPGGAKTGAAALMSSTFTPLFCVCRLARESPPFGGGARRELESAGSAALEPGRLRQQ